MVSPDLSFGPTFTIDDLGGGKDIHKITQKIIEKAQAQFDSHQKEYLSSYDLNPA
jgi:hypothetical protein